MEKKKSIAAKLLEFQCSVETIKKDGINPHFKSTYATLPHILAEVKPILNALKMVVTQPLGGNEVATVIIDTETGEQVSSSVPIPAGLTAQQVGSAITYLRRYTLCSLLALEIDEDDDGNAASGQVRATTQTAPQNGNSKPAKVLPPFPKDDLGEYTRAIEHLTNGGKMEKIEDRYTVSKELKIELLKKANLLPA